MRLRTLSSSTTNTLWRLKLFYLSFLHSDSNKRYVIPAVWGIVILALAYPAMMHAYLNWTTNHNSTLKEIIEIHRDRSAVKLRGKLGAVVGSLGINNFHLSPSTRGLTKRPASVYVQSVPEHFWNMLMDLEDQHLVFEDTTISDLYLHFPSKRSVKGIDIYSQAYRPIQSLFNPSSGLKGGSSLINIMIKNLYGEEYWREECGSGATAKVCRRIREINHASYLFDYLAENDGIEFKRWVAMHAALVISQGSIYGLESAANILFSKTVMDLTIAQQAFLAASYKRASRFGTKDGKDAAANIDRIKERASGAIKRLYSEGDFDTIQSELDSIEIVLPKIASSLEIFTETSSDVRKLGNPERRTKLLKGHETYLKSELPKFTKIFGSDSVFPTEVRLTLPVAKNKIFKERLKKKLSQKLRDIEPSDLDIRVTVANSRGEVLRFYRQGSFLEEGGPFNIKRQIGSISKILALILVLNEEARLSDVMCIQYFAGLKDAGGNVGGDCSSSKDQITLNNTIARSSNLAMMYALQKYAPSKENVIRLMDSAGISFAEDVDAMSLNEMYRDISWGLVLATPAQVHRLINAIGAYTEEWESNVGVYPFKNVSYVRSGVPQVNQISIEELTHNYLDESKNEHSTLLKYLSSGRDTRSDIGRALNAVVKNTGTASFLQSIDSKFVPIMFKTGTTQNLDKNNKDKFITGMFKLRGDFYTISILVGTRSQRGSGLKGLSHRKIHYDIFREVVRTL